MYRYAFRLENRDRSLGDGFGWTILLLGDTGEVTREFLRRYGVELSVKTAHRVRFAFFSGLSAHAINDLQRRSVGRYSSRSWLDRLREGLRGSLWRHGPLDWEDDDWRQLRPDAFTPFTDARGVYEHLDNAYELLQSAIPGAEASAHFAQTLGIGRHVPCLLMFTDVGAPQYHVLPFDERSAAKIYARVRGWVDTYYEINRETLDHWSSVEDQIRSLAGQARATLESVRRWPAERRDEWLDLSALAESTRIVRDHPDAALGELDALVRRRRLNLSFNRELWSLKHRAAELEAREQDAARLTRAARDLQEAADRERVECLLKGLTRKRPPGLSAASLEEIRSARSCFAGPWPTSPDQELFQWWRNCRVPAVAEPVFSQFRDAWREFHLDDRPEQAHRDYAVFWTALGARPLLAEAEDTVEGVLAELAGHYGASHSTSSWVSATASLRRHLIVRIRCAQRNAPASLLRPSPPVLLRECLYTGVRIDDDSLTTFLASSPRLAAALDELTHDPDSWKRHADERLAIGFQDRDTVVRALLQDADRVVTEPESRAVLAAEIVAELSRMRTDFQTAIEKNAERDLDRQPRSTRLEENLEVAGRLDAALREYDDAVRRVVHPHMNDPWVIALTGPPSVADAIRTDPIGVDVGNEPPKVAQALHDAYRGMRDDTRATVPHRDRARREAAQWALDARFAHVLTTVLPEPRAADVLKPFPGDTAREKAARAVRDHRAAELLYVLSHQELAALLEHARPDGAPPPRFQPGETATPAAVLSLFGLRVPPRVFISYAHEDNGGAHQEQVRTLWRLLRRVGIDARLDLLAAEEPQDWALWTHHEYRSADHVLIVASPAYKRRSEGTETPGTGAGVIWEARLIRGEIYARPDDWFRRILRVVLPGGSRDDLPDYLGGHATTCYTVDPLTPEGAEPLVRYLTGQPYEIDSPVGPVPLLPPRSD